MGAVGGEERVVCCESAHCDSHLRAPERSLGEFGACESVYANMQWVVIFDGEM